MTKPLSSAAPRSGRKPSHVIKRDVADLSFAAPPMMGRGAAETIEEEGSVEGSAEPPSPRKPDYSK